jgi:hypothetical protein
MDELRLSCQVQAAQALAYPRCFSASEQRVEQLPPNANAVAVRFVAFASNAWIIERDKVLLERRFCRAMWPTMAGRDGPALRSRPPVVNVRLLAPPPDREIQL